MVSAIRLAVRCSKPICCSTLPASPEPAPPLTEWKSWKPPTRSHRSACRRSDSSTGTGRPAV